jgi:hypothetical protein
MFARSAGHFVAVAQHDSTPLGNVVVSAGCRKTAGPAGGGYGIIMRNQEPSQRDGLTQSGHPYLLEVGDRGEVGVWRRDGEQWAELLN